jgi:signal peptidase II
MLGGRRSPHHPSNPRIGMHTANRSYLRLFWCLALIGVLVDQGTKYGMFAWLYAQPQHIVPRVGFDIYMRWVIPELFSFDANYTHEPVAEGDWRSPLRSISSDKMPGINRGALWGIGGGEAGTDFNTVFAVVSVIAAMAIILWIRRAASRSDRFLCLALGLILAGTLGNLYDRVVFGGVRDWLHWRYVIVMDDFPVFNIADSCLVCGAGLLLLQAFLSEAGGKKEDNATTAGSETAQLDSAIKKHPEACTSQGGSGPTPLPEGSAHFLNPRFSNRG